MAGNYQVAAGIWTQDLWRSSRVLNLWNTSLCHLWALSCLMTSGLGLPSSMGWQDRIITPPSTPRYGRQENLARFPMFTFFSYRFTYILVIKVSSVDHVSSSQLSGVRNSRQVPGDGGGISGVFLQKGKKLQIVIGCIPQSVVTWHGPELFLESYCWHRLAIQVFTIFYVKESIGIIASWKQHNISFSCTIMIY